MDYLKPVDLLVFSPQITARLVYAFEFIFKDILGVQVGFCSNPDEFRQSDLPKINYSTENLQVGLFLKAHSLLFEKNIVKQKIGIVKVDGFYLFFPTSSDSFLPFDPFALSFYLITRYEEYLSENTDEHQRFPDSESILALHELHQTPIVDRAAYWIAGKIRSFYPEFKIRDRHFKLLTTIDIDSAWAYKNKSWRIVLGGVAKNALKGKWANLVTRTAVFMGHRKDPFDTYAYLLDRCEGRLDRLLFFFLMADRHRFDKSISYKNSAFQNLIRQMASVCELGIHPSYMSNERPWLFEMEKKRLEAIVGKPITKSRQHYLRLRFPHTYQTAVNEGITDDYTMGFCSLAGFRAGTCTPFYFFDLSRNKQTHLVVHPFQVMDVTLKNYMNLTPDKALEQIEKLMDEVKEVNGIFVGLFHNESLGDWGEWSGWQKVFEQMLAKGKLLENEFS
jgi:hypothetical protein